MATLSITKTYVDDVVLNAADLDAIADSIETFLNTTNLNDDNIQAEGITASAKIKSATITAEKFAASSVTTIKFANEAVSADKINNDAITTALIEDNTILAPKFDNSVGVATPGTIALFHTFGGGLSVPRGWLICDGSLVTTTNYDIQHGVGSSTEDGVTSSQLINRYLPDFVGRYSVGTADTTDTGSSSISTEGTAGNVKNLAHTHTMNAHTHPLAYTAFLGTFPTTGGDSVAGSYFFTHVTGVWDTQEASNVTTDSKLPAVDIQPESVEFVYIMKVI